MPNVRNFVLSNLEFYHVYNRSVANEEIFVGLRNIRRAISLISYYKNFSSLRFSFFNKLTPDSKKEYLKNHNNALVEIYAYCFMPNHYHILVKQISDRGIERLVSNFQNAFARYFNTRNKRSGALFQRPFKAKRVSKDEELLHISRYIHLNPVTSYLINPDQLSSSSTTSLPFYLTENDNKLVNSQFLINMAGSGHKYLKFVKNQINYQRELRKIKHLILEK